MTDAVQMSPGLNLRLGGLTCAYPVPFPEHKR